MIATLNTCEAEYAKDPKIKKEDIRTLSEWASKQPHLPDITEYNFIQFYQCVGYSLQGTKDIVDSHYEFKNYALDLFFGLDDSPSFPLHQYWESAYTIDTDHVTEEKYRVIYAGLTDASKFHCDVALFEFTRVMYMLVLTKGICQGYVFVFDMKGISLSHLSTLSLSWLKKYLYFVQEVIPLRVRAVHMVNGHAFMDKLMILMKPFLKKELYDMMHIHTDMNKMFENSNIRSDFIPAEVGGTLSTPRAELIEKVKSSLNAFEDKIRKTMIEKSDLKKRVNHRQHDIEILNGSFRKLEVD